MSIFETAPQGIRGRQCHFPKSASASDKFVPVLFSDTSPEQIPTPIRGGTRYVVGTENGYEDARTNIPSVVRAYPAKSKTKQPNTNKMFYYTSAPSKILRPKTNVYIEMLLSSPITV